MAIEEDVDESLTILGSGGRGTRLPDDLMDGPETTSGIEPAGGEADILRSADPLEEDELTDETLAGPGSPRAEGPTRSHNRE
jgi:hypothetical protein